MFEIGFILHFRFTVIEKILVFSPWSPLLVSLFLSLGKTLVSSGLRSLK